VQLDKELLKAEVRPGTYEDIHMQHFIGVNAFPTTDHETSLLGSSQARPS